MNKVHVLLCGTPFVLALVLCGSVAHAKQASSAGNTENAPQASAANNPQDGQRPVLQDRNPRYQLCKDDVLELSLPLTPEFNQTVTVQPDGYITLAAAGDIHVEGQTIAEVTQAIKAAYANILHEPIITVHLKDFEKPYFIVGGEIGHPGKYDLRGDTTVIQAVAIGGGFTESSKHSQVWLFRRVSNDWVESRKLDVKKMLSAGNLSEDLHLRPGDMLYVPKSALGKVRRYIPVASMGSYFNPTP
jgi:protein involved in polysaccharide export with SLBB domain